MTIYFNEDCAYWSIDNKMNEHFINHNVDHIRNLVRHRGYIYENQIFEIFGAEWDARF